MQKGDEDTKIESEFEEEIEEDFNNPIYNLVKDIILKFPIINNQKKNAIHISETNKNLPILSNNDISNFTIAIVENALLVYVFDKKKFSIVKYRSGNMDGFTFHPSHIYSLVTQDKFYTRIETKQRKHTNYQNFVDPYTMMAIDIIQCWENLLNMKEKFILLDRPIIFENEKQSDYVFSLLEKSSTHSRIKEVKVNT